MAPMPGMAIRFLPLAPGVSRAAAKMLSGWLLGLWRKFKSVPRVAPA